MFKKILVALAAMVAMTGGVVAFTATPAAASGCTIYNNIDVGTFVPGPGPSGAYGFYRVRGYFTKPAPGCNDVQFRNFEDNTSLTNGWGQAWISLTAPGCPTCSPYLWDYAALHENDGGGWHIAHYNVPTGTLIQLYVIGQGSGPYRIDMMF